MRGIMYYILDCIEENNMEKREPEQQTGKTAEKAAGDGTGQGKMTIADVADALNISKTTVSRAISGKGRIGAETRRRVMEYIEEHNYKPSVIAKGLAQSKSYNIGWVMPSDYSVVDLPFFRSALWDFWRWLRRWITMYLFVQYLQMI